MKQITITKEGAATIVAIQKTINETTINETITYNKSINLIKIPNSQKVVGYDPERINQPLRFSFNELTEKLGATNIDEYLTNAASIGLFNVNATGLVLSKELKMNLLLDQRSITSGLLVVGKRYVIYDGDLQAGDNFANVGFVAVDEAFVATGTTPTTWTNGSSVVPLTAEVFEFKNTTDTTFEVVVNPDYSVDVIFDEAIFPDVNKIFIPSLGNGSWELTDDSSIKFDNLLSINSLNPIVIEVYE